MVEVIWHGRLGNRMIQYSVGLILAERLKVKLINPVEEICNNQNYYSDFFDCVNVRRGSYELIITDPIINVDDNFLLDIPIVLTPGHYKVDGSCQINDLLIEYTSCLRDIFNFKQPITPKSGVWVHARLGDVPEQSSGTLEYYRKALSQLNCKEGVIATDATSINSQLVQTLQKEFNLSINIDTPIKTLSESRNYSTKVLSSGTYSWWMGMLVDGDVIYYDVPQEYKWHMPIFNRPGWRALC